MKRGDGSRVSPKVKRKNRPRASLKKGVSRDDSRKEK